MFGLLGGLVGRAVGGGLRAGGSGLLGGLMRYGQRVAQSRARSAPADSGPSRPGIMRGRFDGERSEGMVARNSTPQRQDQPIQQATAEGPRLVEGLAQNFRERSSPVNGLLDEPAPIQQRPGFLGRVVQNVVNRGDGMMPVGRDAAEAFGETPGVPQADAPDTGVNILAPLRRRLFAQQDAPIQRQPFQNEKYSTHVDRGSQPATVEAYSPRYTYMA